MFKPERICHILVPPTENSGLGQKSGNARTKEEETPAKNPNNTTLWMKRWNGTRSPWLLITGYKNSVMSWDDISID